MKKILSILLCAVLLCTFAGCDFEMGRDETPVMAEASGITFSVPKSWKRKESSPNVYYYVGNGDFLLIQVVAEQESLTDAAWDNWLKGLAESTSHKDFMQLGKGVRQFDNGILFHYVKFSAVYTSKKGISETYGCSTTANSTKLQCLILTVRTAIRSEWSRFFRPLDSQSNLCP